MRDGLTLLGEEIARRGLIGQGGYITGGETLGDGTILARSDTFNGWIRPAGGAEFIPFFRPGDNIAATDILFDPAAQGVGSYDWGRVGTYDIAGCFTNSNYLWAHSMFHLYKTVDGGATVTKVTAFPQNFDSNLNPNDLRRTQGRFIAVDPANGDHCLIGTPTGVFRTTDGGTTWTNLATASGLPAHGANLRTQIAFDRSSTVTGSITQTIYAFVNDSGLYKSVNGGAAWTAVGGAGAPTSANNLKVHHVTGMVYTAGTSSGASSAQLYRCDPAGPTWDAPTVVTSVKAIAISPHNPAHIYAQQTFGSMFVSDNYGVSGSWKLVPSLSGEFNMVAPNNPWLAVDDNISNGDLAFDPSVNRLVLFEGYGVWTSTNPPSTTTSAITQWVNIGTGIDSLVCMGLTSIPRAGSHLAGQDKATFNFTKADLKGRLMASTYGVIDGLKYAQMAPDYAIDDHNFIAVATGAGANSGGYSTDKGKTWNLFAADSGFIYGNIAVSNKLNMVWVGGNNAGIKYTLDGCESWLVPTGFPVGYTHFINAYNYPRRTIVADKNNPGHFYLYAHGTGGSGQDANAVGFWKSIDGGASFTRVFALPVSHATNYGIDFYNGKLKQVISQPGHFFWTGGNNGDGLHKNTNYCAGTTREGDWPKVGPMTEVFAYGIGAAKPGASYPTIRAVGWGPDPADAVVKYGFWDSFDGGTMWVYAAQFFRNKHDAVLDIAGDPTEYGTWAICYAGSGFDLITREDKYNFA